MSPFLDWKQLQRLVPSIGGRKQQNQVERWFGHMTQQSIRGGSFATIKQLIRRIDAFVHHYNLHPPFPLDRYRRFHSRQDRATF